MMRYMMGRKTGFTLIEIMIVIAIIAILAGIAVPNIMMARFESGITACQENCRVGMQAVQMAMVRKSFKQLVYELCNYSGSSIMQQRWLDEQLTARYDVVWEFEVDRFMELGYLDKKLRCPVTNSEYYLLRETRWNYPVYFDWRLEQSVPFKGDFIGVLCYSDYGHMMDGKESWPAYSMNHGACFLY